MYRWLPFVCAITLAAAWASDTNIALGKPVTASGPAWFPPANITDGDTATISHPQVIPAQGYYFQVDLGQEFSLQVIHVYSRVECCADRLSNVRMSVYADAGGSPGAENWFYDIRPNGAPNLQGGVDVLTADLHAAGTFYGRFLRITNIASTTYAPQVAELEAFETPPADIRYFGPDVGNITAVGAPGKPTQATLSWNVQGYTALSIDQGIGTVSGPLGSVVVSPQVTTQYTLTAFNGAGSVTRTVTIGVDEPELPPALSEFLASNVTGLKDSNGKHSDWVELFNPNTFAINLKGFYLTDTPADLKKWRFTSFVVPGNGYSIVFADGSTNGADSFDTPHANFTLSPDGEYVALVSTDGTTVLGQFPSTYPNPAQYPKQSSDHSYGVSGGVEGFFSIPTPNAPNGVRSDGLVSEVAFSVRRGFYDTPQAVELTCATQGAEIRYTLDGSHPTPTTGTVYSGPINISTTTVLRAAAFKNGWQAANVETNTYIFTASVIASTPWAAPGIVSSPTYGPQMAASLKQVPSMSLSTAPGVTIDGGDANQAVIEWVDPAGGTGFQSPCGAKLFGGAFTNFAKKNFRISFKAEFGAPKLSFPLFSGFERGLAAATDFDYFELRGGSHDMEQRGFYMSNPFTDATMLDMGSFAPHQRFVHLYINGVYWGLFQLRERWGADMLASYFGGDRSEYESINGNLNVGGWADPGSPYDGTGATWETMKSLARSGPDTYAKLQPLLDTPQFVDYMIMFMFGDSEDEYRTCGPAGPGHGAKFLLNDADGFLRTSAGNRTGMGAPGRAAGDGPGSLFSMLFRDGGPDFRRLLADRICKAYVNPNGALTPAKNSARLTELCNAINVAIIAECARWNYRTPANWASSRDAILSSWFPSRTATVLNQFKAAGFYPDPEAPVFTPPPGNVAAGTQLTMTSATSNTKIYYTTSGEDPYAGVEVEFSAPLITNATPGKFHIPTSDTDGFNQTAIPNLVAYWPLDANTFDVAGGYNGTLTNGAAIGGAGKFGGGGLILDGANDYVAIGDPAGLQILGQITIAAWVKPALVNGIRNIVNKGHDTGTPNGEITLRIIDGAYQGGYWAGGAGSVIAIGPAGGANSATADVGTWTHVAIVWDGANWRLYRNGVQISSAPSSVGAVPCPTVGWAIGARGTGTERYFGGEIDEVRIYNRGLAPAEIGALFDNSATAQGAVWVQPAQDDSLWNAASGALGFAPVGDELAAGITQDIGANMLGVNAGVFLRLPFTLTAQERTETQLLRLRIRSDDGYVAYLNGSRVASRNAPLTLNGISGATAETADSEALAEETIDLNSAIPLLQTGTNILAIHGLNLSASDDDFLLAAELDSHRGNPGLASSAQQYAGPFPLNENTLIRARSYSETTKQWSALAEGFFQIGAEACPPGALAVSELNYNPAGDDESSEFIELINIAPVAINLQGAYFTDGVEFTFPANRPVPLGPGQRIVLVSDELSFQRVHGWAENVAGMYAGNLNNDGERLRIVTADGLVTLLDFIYDDDAPWPPGADGGGFDLVFINPGPGRDQNDPANWRVGVVENGNPNGDDTIPSDLAPSIVNGPQATFAVGSEGNFNFRSSGLPAPSLTIGGDALPVGVAFIDNGDGTATLSGTPAAVTGGVYSLVVTASNISGPDAVQTFTLTITEIPVITSLDGAFFIAETPCAFTVAARGYPMPSLYIAGEPLPSGVTFTDAGNGTALLAGTPEAITKDYALIVTAANNEGVSEPQMFTLTVQQLPDITSPLSATGTATTPFAYQITASHSPSSFGASPLPGGLSVNAAGLISGAPAAAGTTLVQISATNAVGTRFATLSLKIQPAPVVPHISSGPIATPNPAKVQTEVAFSCVGNATGVTWSWDFGDGSTDTSNTSSPRHTFAAKGNYDVTATVTNIIGQTDSATVRVVVTLSGLPPGVSATIVPVEIMYALGLDPEDPAQSPLGADEQSKLVSVPVLSVSALKLNYKVPNKDQISLKWTMQGKPSLSAAGEQFVVDFGGVVRIFTLQTKGKGIIAVPTSGSKNESLKIKAKAGVWSMAASFKNGAFVETLKKINGLGKDDSANAIRNAAVDFHVLYNAHLYRRLALPVTFKYNAKSQSGSGKSP